jgi:hypothetical protein
VAIHRSISPIINGDKIISLKDYDCLEDNELIQYDKRSITTLIKDNLVTEHILVSLIFNSSLYEPTFLSFFDLIFTLSIQAGTNALLFSDDYIDSRNNSPTNVNRYKLTYSLVSYILFPMSWISLYSV